ncbi:hypothetical protein [Desulfopila sp. IMCC35008]|uniref:hypothetical protein n=1 Tax=Desulfopila sp. IMCC35008 TaxID=2653858 RepID=UPI0013D7C563|nr:hypothetical protein [Desulfopila sp. IMCC35008]
MKDFRSPIILFLTGVLVFAGCNAHAQSHGKLNSAVDALEIQLEMGRHDQFIEIKQHSENVLNEFSTDGCSGGLSVGWEYLAGKIESFHEIHGTQPAWESCCITHDRVYHSGGSGVTTPEASFEARKKADEELQNCVVQTGIERSTLLSKEYHLPPEEVERLYGVIAKLMYRAVRVGGMPCTGLPWRWGYGWPECSEN